MNPTYDLKAIVELISKGEYRITGRAIDDALGLGFDDDDIKDCVTNSLNDTHFYKTMEADWIPGLYQDVYKLRYEGQRIYLKLQINKAGTAVVISFKEDESV